MATISGTSFGAMSETISTTISRAVPREIPRAISGTTFEAILQVKKEIELRKVEGNVQQFRAEWEKYSRVQWHSEKNKSCLKQQTELKSAIDELWELMKIPKHSYNIMNK